MGKKSVNVIKLKNMKKAGEAIAMVTAYDYPSARLAEEAGVDMLLVGDSLGNVVLGYDSTIPVTLDDMVYHTRAVARGAEHTFIVADMPFMTYHGSLDDTLQGVRRLMQEGGAQAVKLEGGSEIADTVAAIVNAGVPVLGHIGLTPQSVHQIGGHRIQGKDERDAKRLMADAKALQEAGVFALVLELVTEEVAEKITNELDIPTIGIGAGRGTSGQVLVFHDLLQYTDDYFAKRFVKTYANIGEQIRLGIEGYVKDVKGKAFPAEENVFPADQELIESLYGKTTGKVGNHS